MIDDKTHPCSILLIDDEPFAQDFIEHCLDSCVDVQLRYSSRAEQVVALALEFNATVVLVDLRMPVVDGFDVIRMLRQHRDTEHLPVILLSSEEDADIKAKAFACGANDYLVKWPDGRCLLYTSPSPRD